MTNTTLINALVYNNRFATVRTDGDQLGVENFSTWKKLIVKLHRSAYAVYVQCENSGMKAESNTVDKSAIFADIRDILAYIGDVNERKLVANAETAIAIIAYAGKRGNVDSAELQLCSSRLSHAQNELAKYLKLNVTDEAHKAKKVAEMEAEIEALTAEKSELLKTADMRIKKPTMTTENAFRLDVEHYLARVISGQLAKTLEELDAEAEARRKERNDRARARKAAKNA